MKEKMKELRVNVTVSAVLTIVLGVLLIMYAGSFLTMFAKIFAVIVLIIGVVMAAGGIVESQMSRLISGVIIIAVGIWAYSRPTTISSIIPIAIGVLLVVHGIQDLRLAIDAKKHKSESFGAMIGVAIVSIVFGVICIAEAFNIISLALQLVGVMLVIDGITDMFVVHKVNKAHRDIIDATEYTEEDLDDYGQGTNADDVIDVDSEEEDD